MGEPGEGADLSLQASVSAVKPPCFKAFLLPLGVPPAAPCSGIPPAPPQTAGAWHVARSASISRPPSRARAYCARNSSDVYGYLFPRGDDLAELEAGRTAALRLKGPRDISHFTQEGCVRKSGEQIITVNSWSDLQTVLNNPQLRGWAFRGQSDATWPLLSHFRAI